MDSHVVKHPAWRAALQKMRDNRVQHGDFFTLDELYGLMDLPLPKDADSFEDGERRKLAFLAQFEPLRDALLREDLMDLVNEFGKGYRIVQPREQATKAADQAARDARKALRNGIKRAVYVNSDMLTDSERTEQTNIVAALKRTAVAISRKKLLRWDPST